MGKIALLAAAIMIAAPVASAAAEPAGAWKVGNNSYHLYLQDLDLQTVSGRAEALVRAEKAARKLCKDGTKARRDACVEATLTTATTGSAQAALRLAMAERASVWLAAR